MTSATHTKQIASAALASFLQARTAEVPTSDVSRTLRRKQQRERKKRSRSHSSVDPGEKGNSEFKLSGTGSKKDPRRSTTISKEERDIRQRILQMRENKRKGKPIVQPKNSAVDSDESDDDF
ncbi:hypothetical protein TWF106_003782 [Orbilia oligospora]|uniref:Uncharacterized protein n=1 Tax=Orbilia oligospora TaxID=2813651 RepID=A0A6G1MM06_ORBOL|nr:hypothetical protein TWF788_003071 [Orbilia oligospora]KAF3199458.1 hypothetical protein TWF106_003782 [Orbilia oligospora]KAF3199650.1 hypothetical protein TWF679_001268 [Orbilia oligospora]KAF3219356.1 hypothetical protein TWF191_007903 [Orbilia oligospora]KAF3261760.1 hypothetical protein TWF192_008218 [Orbilia oligospora]